MLTLAAGGGLSYFLSSLASILRCEMTFLRNHFLALRQVFP